MTIRAKNELTNSGYARTTTPSSPFASLGGSVVRPGVRTDSKSSKDYLRIRRLLEEETAVQRCMYVALEPKLANFILECFAGTKAVLLVGLAEDFNRPFTEMRVTDANSGRVLPILEAL